MTDDEIRAAFEAWLNPGQHAGNVSPWVAPGRYEKDTHQLAWLAWREATKGALDAAARVCDVTPPYPFRPSIEAAHAIRALKPA